MMNSDSLQSAIRRTSVVMVLMFLALTVITGYWQAMRGPALSVREDNPRLVLAERNVPRGAILDRNGHPLAVSQSTADGYARYYPERAAAPVVGYYSLQHGLGGAEAAFDDELRGTVGRTRSEIFVDDLLHRVPVGQSVRLTLDLSAQQAADAALGDRAGAVVVLSVPEGEVIALASHPTFDPATLDEDWERLRTDAASPLVNRATQGVYQPGAAFQTIVLAEALLRGTTYLTSTVQAHTPVQVGSATLNCASTPLSNTIAAAYAVGCPAPFVMLADQLDAASLAVAIQRWQLDTITNGFELPVHTSAWSPGMLTTTQAVRELALGQGALTISPLQMATVIGTIANNGHSIMMPHITFAAAPSSQSFSPMSPEVALSLQNALTMRQDLAGQVTLAASGENRLAWFLGFAPIHSPQWAIVVLLENGDAAADWQIATSVRTKLAP